MPKDSHSSSRASVPRHHRQVSPSVSEHELLAAEFENAFLHNFVLLHMCMVAQTDLPTPTAPFASILAAATVGADAQSRRGVSLGHGTQEARFLNVSKPMNLKHKIESAEKS